MKSFNLFTTLLLAALVLVSIESCDKHPGCTDANATNYNVNATSDNGSCQYDATFYYDVNGANATVNISNQTGMVTGAYTSGAPTCGVGVQGCANFSLPVGSFNFTASSAFSTWSGPVVVNGSGCQDVLLPQGQATFWTAATNYGNITVVINGVTANAATITSYITGGTPPCGFTGCATFGMAPGTYNYTASAASPSTATWNGTVTVTQDGCASVQLQ